MDASKKAEISRATRSLIHRCLPQLEEPGILHQFPSLDSLRKSCEEQAERRGYNLEPIEPYLVSGLTFSVTAYAHLDLGARVYVAIFTACFFCIDDNYSPGADMSSLQLAHLMTHRGPFEDPAQETYYKLLLDAEEFYPNAPASSMIITSVTAFANSFIIEGQTEGMKLPYAAKEFANYSRRLSGLGEGFALLAFPPHVPFTDYIFAMPDMLLFLEAGNDVLSFYKEEAAGESVNRISLLAEADGCSKVEALEKSADDTVRSHEKVLKTLEINPEALKAYQHFSYGYLWFHCCLKRYRLAELWDAVDSSSRLDAGADTCS